MRSLRHISCTNRSHRVGMKLLIWSLYRIGHTLSFSIPLSRGLCGVVFRILDRKTWLALVMVVVSFRLHSREQSVKATASITDVSSI